MAVMRRLDDYQAQHLRGDPDALGMLYLALVGAARRVCWALAVHQCGITIDQARVTQLAHDAASRIVERYLRHAHYRIRSWSPVIRLEVLHALTDGGHGDRPTRRMIERAGSLSPEIESSPVQGEDPSGYLQDLLCHERGRDIVLALVLSTTYRKAVLAVGEIAPRQWIYDHAVQLRHVWMMTRRRRVQTHSGDDPGCRHRGGGEKAVPEVRPDAQRCRQRAAARVHHDRGGA